MKIGFVSLGCPKNLVDSEVMLGLTQQAGHQVTNDLQAAEVLVVNTCAFIDGAKQESVDTILDLARQKQDGACRRLIVTGCLGERYRSELQQLIPEVDVVLGTGDVPGIVDAIDGEPALSNGTNEAGTPTRESGRPIIPSSPVTAVPGVTAVPADAAAPLPTYLYDADTPRVLTTPDHYAYLKVAEGCDYACSFCIIPTLRGHYRSRTEASIVDEARRLAARGVRELILVSQDTTFYGIDRGERGALGRLLRALNGVDGLEWIRLLYLYPTTVTDATLAAMAECEKVCRYIDLPLQHASDRLLRAMNRPGGRRAYEALLARIRERLPGVALRTTFIVGFPGETEEDVSELAGFLADVQFDHVGIFAYSHEAGTTAFNLTDDVPSAEKQRRRRRLMALQRRIVRQERRRRIGQVERVMVDGASPEHDLVVQGRLQSQAPDIDSVVYLTDCNPSTLVPGMVVPVEVVAARDYDLVARPVDQAPGAGTAAAAGVSRTAG